MRRGGFTLLEVLVVIGVLGILLAVGVPSYLNWLASVQVQGAAVSLAQQIHRVRTEVKRAALPTAGTQPQLQVATTSGSGTFTAGGRTVTLDGATIQTTGTLTFQAPYGTLALTSSLPQTFTLRSTRNTSKTRTVRVISVLGKVVVQ